MKKIPLSRGLFVMVDDEDYTELNKYKWCAGKGKNTFYAIRNIRKENGEYTTILMHRAIMNISLNMQCDHIDGNGLNNCKDNLREVTNRQNAQNNHTNKTSKYPGICWLKRDKRWQARIRFNGKRKYLGNYMHELDAYNAYIKAVEELGEVPLVI
jgi:hypothetical protein